jgi:6-phosphofructokinase
MNFGVLTGGGDSSGINDFLYFLAKRLESEGHTLTGFRSSWLGMVNNDAITLTTSMLAPHRHTASTVLGSERKNPIKDGQMDLVLASLEDRKIDAMICMGGDDTLGVAAHLAGLGFNVVGAPQTIDDDIRFTDHTLGYETAVRQAATFINSMINSNVGHDKDMIVEVMGRDAGWLALGTAMNTPACACMCPEGPMELEEMIERMKAYKKRTGRAGLAIVSEGIELKGVDRGELRKDAFGNVYTAGVSHYVGEKYEAATGRKPRVQVMGYLLRGGVPSPADVELALSFANQAVDLALAGKTGYMVTRWEGREQAIPLKDVAGGKKYADPKYLEQQFARILE